MQVIKNIAEGLRIFQMQRKLRRNVTSFHNLLHEFLAQVHYLVCNKIRLKIHKLA